jgi:hypothetical protein
LSMTFGLPSSDYSGNLEYDSCDRLCEVSICVYCPATCDRRRDYLESGPSMARRLQTILRPARHAVSRPSCGLVPLPACLRHDSRLDRTCTFWLSGYLRSRAGQALNRMCRACARSRAPQQGTPGSHPSVTPGLSPLVTPGLSPLVAPGHLHVTASLQRPPILPVLQKSAPSRLCKLSHSSSQSSAHCTVYR